MVTTTTQIASDITTSASPYFTSSPSDSGNSNPATNTSSLYLFTFLATLLLLLAVSCAIIVRSFVLRRRFRRRVEEALAAGILFPPNGSRRRDIGEKPKLWDAWLELSGASWQEMNPVSARVISDYHTGSGEPLVAKEIQPMPSRANLRRLFARKEQSTTSLASTTSDLPLPTQATLQVAVLIAMPFPYRTIPTSNPTLKGKERALARDTDLDDEVPNLVIAVTELEWVIPPSADPGPPSPTPS